jgi:hypothetical protein
LLTLVTPLSGSEAASAMSTSGVGKRPELESALAGRAPHTVPVGQEEISLVLGGPLYQLYLRTRPVQAPFDLLHRSPEEIRFKRHKLSSTVGSRCVTATTL